MNGACAACAACYHDHSTCSHHTTISTESAFPNKNTASLSGQTDARQWATQRRTSSNSRLVHLRWHKFEIQTKFSEKLRWRVKLVLSCEPQGGTCCQRNRSPICSTVRPLPTPQPSQQNQLKVNTIPHHLSSTIVKFHPSLLPHFVFKIRSKCRHFEWLAIHKIGWVFSLTDECSSVLLTRCLHVAPLSSFRPHFIAWVVSKYSWTTVFQIEICFPTVFSCLFSCAVLRPRLSPSATGKWVPNQQRVRLVSGIFKQMLVCVTLFVFWRITLIQYNVPSVRFSSGDLIWKTNYFCWTAERATSRILCSPRFIVTHIAPFWCSLQ